MVRQCSLSPRNISALSLAISLILWGVPAIAGNDDIKFNTNVLDVNEKQEIDLSRFSSAGYIMPGTYVLQMHINRQPVSEQEVVYLPPDNEPEKSVACLSPALVKLLGLKPGILTNLSWWNNGQCLAVNSLPGLDVKGDLGRNTLDITLPDSALEYASDDWEPPSRWDNGIAGILVDYNINAQKQRSGNISDSGNDINANGVLGVNAGAWRLRADWQAALDKQRRERSQKKRSWDFSRYYAYRALPQWKAKLEVGEDYLSSDLFDGFLFAGVSVRTEDNMLPPNLRGYAPEVTGIARTNARVIISQQGRVLKEEQVAAGEFTIRSLSNAVSGTLDIRVEEQDGNVQQYQINTASIPYLTRPGQIRYKLAAGKPIESGHRSSGPEFAIGELSWGVNNGWSLYGGGIASKEYQAAAIGLGRDLSFLGALSFDVTQSRASPGEFQRESGESNSTGTLSGRSYRLSYSKRFDEYDSQITFAGYRFSEKSYMSMNEYLLMRQSGERAGNNKETYTVTLSKVFRDIGLSAYVNYNHQTYWDRPDNDRYNLTLSRTLNIGAFKGISFSLSAFRNKSFGYNDDGMYLSLSIPWRQASISYSSSLNRSGADHNVSYSQSRDGQSFQLGAGTSNAGQSVSGYYNYQGDLASVTTSGTYQPGQSSSLGLQLQGGATITAKGAALHRTTSNGGSRIMVDTDGVANVPVRGFGPVSRSNWFGKAVIPEVGNYIRGDVRIDVNAMPQNADAVNTVSQATLTEGAIGYRHFDVVFGEKLMAIIRLADGSFPPFGAVILNRKKREVGIVGENGNTYLTGVNAKEEMQVKWGEDKSCVLTLPPLLPTNALSANIFLPCQ